MKLSDLRSIKWRPLQELDRGLSANFSAYGELIKRGNENIKTLNDVLEKNLLDIRNSYDPDDEVAWSHESYCYDFEMPIIDSYQNIFWRSLIVSQIALVESTQKFLASLVNEKLNMCTPLIHSNRKIVHCYHSQLIKLFAISSNQMNSIWPKIDLAIKIRNLITHNDFSEFEKYANQVNKIKSVKIIIEDDGSYLLEIINGDYAKFLIKVCEDYCNELIDSIDGEYKRQCKQRGVHYF